MAVEYRSFGIADTDLRRIAVVTHVSPQCRGGSAGPRAADDPSRYRMGLLAQLAEHGLRNVVVAAPVRRPLGIRELIQVVARHLPCQPLGLEVDGLRLVDEMTLAALEFDGGDLLSGGGPRHH